MIKASIIYDAIGDDAPRILTFELIYPRFIHAELMTHRVFSRNAASSRAIPVMTMIQMIRDNIALPASWRFNEKGMQGFTEVPETIAHQAEMLWRMGLEAVIPIAERMNDINLHKQHINRLLEPWALIRTVVTSTQWANWFSLRDHPDADPTIAALAAEMKKAMDASTPTHIAAGEWYLPYVSGDQDTIDGCIEWADNVSMIDIQKFRLPAHSREAVATEVMKRVSAARCARTSYKTFDGQKSKVSADFDLFNKLVSADLIHASPTEHQATPDKFHPMTNRWMTSQRHGNFNGWIQHRKELPNENQDNIVGAIF